MTEQAPKEFDPNSVRKVLSVKAPPEVEVPMAPTSKVNPQNQFYGDRNGYIVDPFGHGWVIATHVEDVKPDEMMRRMTALQG